jgi:hypothetical protein
MKTKTHSASGNGSPQVPGRPRGNSPTLAMRQIAAIRLQELRELGATHTEIAGMFGLTPARIEQLCGELCGEESRERGFGLS